jgi:hypothetical protein
MDAWAVKTIILFVGIVITIVALSLIDRAVNG